MTAASSAGRVSVLTAPGRGAIAVIAATGPAAARAADRNFTAANGRPLAAQPVDRVIFGRWMSAGHEEEIIVVRGPSGSVEVHCHGGAAASQRIVESFIAAGCRQLDWRQWIAATSSSPLTAEADLALARATTRRAAAILLDQRNGALERAIVGVEAHLAAGDEGAAAAELSALSGLSWLGLHLVEPWRVAIAGEPNVGKSTLSNALLGHQRSIVFDQPGTTRDVLAAETAIDGWPVQISDAAGIREALDPLEAEGVRRARQRLLLADLILWVVDATAPGRAASEPASSIEASLPAATPLITVVNKSDLAPAGAHRGDVAVSAMQGTGLEQLLALISTRLAPAPPSPGAAVPFTTRQVQLIDQAAGYLEQGDAASAIASLGALRRGGAAPGLKSP